MHVAFARDLAYSGEHEPAWETFYRRVWPETVGVEAVDDPDLQRAGVDRLVMVRSGRAYTIDEKVVRSWRGDLWVELWSQWYGEGDERNRPGWTVDPHKRCDYVAYAAPAAGTCYLLPADLLRRAARRMAPRWVAAYRERVVPNGAYETRAVPVPVDEVLRAMAREVRAAWGDDKEE